MFGLLPGVKKSIQTLIIPALLATLGNLQACHRTGSGDDSGASASVCGFDGTQLSKSYDLGFNHPIDCIALTRSAPGKDHHIGISLWASRSRVMPKMYFPLILTAEAAPGATYSTQSTATIKAVNEPAEYVESPSAQVRFGEIAREKNGISGGTLEIHAKNTADGQTRSALIEFAAPTEVK